MSKEDWILTIFGVFAVLLLVGGCSFVLNKGNQEYKKREQLELEMCRKHRDNGWPVERRKETCLDKYPELSR